MMEKLSGKTTLLGLIGSPVSHSMSPAMYNYSFERLGIDACYLAFDVNNAFGLVCVIQRNGVVIKRGNRNFFSFFFICTIGSLVKSKCVAVAFKGNGVVAENSFVKSDETVGFTNDA